MIIQPKYSSTIQLNSCSYQLNDRRSSGIICASTIIVHNQPVVRVATNDEINRFSEKKIVDLSK